MLGYAKLLYFVTALCMALRYLFHNEDAFSERIITR